MEEEKCCGVADEERKEAEMNVDVMFKGMSTKGSEYACGDGELAYADGFEQDGGGLRNTAFGEYLGDVAEGMRLMYIHNLPGGGRNYILHGGGCLKWSSSIDEEGEHMARTAAVYAVTNMGNVLCAMTEEGMLCAVWNGERYNVMSGSIPEVDAQFGLSGDFVNTQYDEDVVYKANELYLEEGGTVIATCNFGWERGEDRTSKKTETSVLGSQNCLEYGSTYIIERGQDGPFTLNIAEQKLYLVCYEGRRVYKRLNTSQGSQYSDKLLFRVDDKTASHVLIEVTYSGKEEREDNGSTFSYTLRPNGENSDKSGNRLAEQGGVDSYATVRSMVNRFLNERVSQQNKFCDPFFARCALRMYDGNIVSLSAPCLLVPCTASVPLVYTTTGFGLKKELKDENGKEYTIRGSKMFVGAMCCDLYVDMGDLKSRLESWKDLITEVVIAVTKPIRRYDSTDDKGVLRSGMYFKDWTSIEGGVSYLKEGAQSVFGKIAALTGALPTSFVHLPQHNDMSVQIEQASNFYIVKTIGVEDLGSYNGMTKIDMSGMDFSALAEKETLPDDTSSLNSYMPTRAYTFNNRLHIANYREKMFGGYLTGMANGVVGSGAGSEIVVVEVHEKGNTYYVKKTGSATSAPLMYCYYPNPNAKRIWVKNTEGIYSVPLKMHPMLNGAYWFDDFNAMLSCDKMHVGEENVIIEKQNYMRLSEADNPFVFRNVNTFAFDSDILALCSAVTALSTGQKGQFDLYIFTKRDGVWSLKINEQGTYTRYVATVRDVICGDGGSLCQMDGSVLFASARGVMELSGSASRCISEDIGKVSGSGIGELGGLEKIGDVGDDAVGDIKNYIKEGCGIVYDYTNQRVLVFSDGRDFFYVYNIRSGAWTVSTGLKGVNIEYAVNSYPDAYVVASGGLLLNLSHIGVDDSIMMNNGKCVLVTRALKFGDAMAFKRVMAVRLNGSLNKNRVKMILYGSNDLMKWFVVGSVNGVRLALGAGGSPYRFFKLAVGAEMGYDEDVVGATFNVVVTDKNEKLY